MTLSIGCLLPPTILISLLLYAYCTFEKRQARVASVEQTAISINSMEEFIEYCRIERFEYYVTKYDGKVVAVWMRNTRWWLVGDEDTLIRVDFNTKPQKVTREVLYD